MNLFDAKGMEKGKKIYADVLGTQNCLGANKLRQLIHSRAVVSMEPPFIVQQDMRCHNTETQSENVFIGSSTDFYFSSLLMEGGKNKGNPNLGARCAEGHEFKEWLSGATDWCGSFMQSDCKVVTVSDCPGFITCIRDERHVNFHIYSFKDSILSDGVNICGNTVDEFLLRQLSQLQAGSGGDLAAAAASSSPGVQTERVHAKLYLQGVGNWCEVLLHIVLLEEHFVVLHFSWVLTEWSGGKINKNGLKQANIHMKAAFMEYTYANLLHAASEIRNVKENLLSGYEVTGDVPLRVGRWEVCHGRGMLSGLFRRTSEDSIVQMIKDRCLLRNRVCTGPDDVD